MSDKETIRRALIDAIDWQSSLADAVRHCADGEYERCKEQEKKYRALMKNRYGYSKTPLEIHFEGAKAVSVFDVITGPKTCRSSASG